MKNYKVLIEVPLLEIPEGINIQEVIMGFERWLLYKIPDAKILSFKEERMKARDTVMDFMRIEEIDAKNATSNFTDALVDVAREQAEITWKICLEEVVEWIESHTLIKPDKDSITRFEPFYQIVQSELNILKEKLFPCQ